jgi:hypothetical protein
MTTSTQSLTSTELSHLLQARARGQAVLAPNPATAQLFRPRAGGSFDDLDAGRAEFYPARLGVYGADEYR